MPIKSILFLGAFGLCATGALVEPMLGVLAYMAHYCIGAENQWWAEPIRSWGIRYSFILGATTAVGLLLQHWRLRFGASALVGQEILALAFLAVVWLGVVWGWDSSGQEMLAGQDPTCWKMTKVIFFALMLTHIVTTMADLDWIVWVLIVTAFILGLQAFDTPYEAFSSQGRLETVGGPDFRDSVILGGYLSAMLPIIGTQFLRSKWLGKLVCVMAGAFVTNAVVLTRSRGAVVGLAVGSVAALLLAPGKHRKKILVGLAVAVAGGLYLVDRGFVERAQTITASEEERDRSAQSRIEIWEGGVEMLLANPLGVGPDNFRKAIGHYSLQNPDRDAHNTFVRCAGELGFPGILLYGALIGNAFKMLWGIVKKARDLPAAERDRLTYMSYGIAISIIIFLSAGQTSSMVYIEGLWWLLLLPVSVERALENAREDLRPARVQITPGPACIPGNKLAGG